MAFHTKFLCSRSDPKSSLDTPPATPNCLLISLHPSALIQGMLLPSTASLLLATFTFERGGEEGGGVPVVQVVEEGGGEGGEREKGEGRAREEGRGTDGEGEGRSGRGRREGRGGKGERQTFSVHVADPAGWTEITFQRKEKTIKMPEEKRKEKHMNKNN